MWFILALITMLAWGMADLFYKISSDENERYSHFKIAVWVGIVMGLGALVILPFTETDFSFGSLLSSAIKYAPASVSYIISMVIGYAGMRYLEISIISPVQNASGALSSALMIAYFFITGKIFGIKEALSLMDITGTLLIFAGVVALAFAEQKIAEKSMTDDDKTAVSKYRKGALALIFPILYCVFDTVGTAADGIILDDRKGFGLGEKDVLVLYGLTFLLAGAASWIFLLVKEKKPYNPFKWGEFKTKGIAALFEEAGQVFYVYAMAARPVVAAPMIASYCIVSVILSRIFIREKLKLSQYICVALVVAGIVILGFGEE